MGKRDSESKMIAYINFRGAKNEYLGRFDFYKEGQPIPDNSEYGSSTITPTRIYLHASVNQMQGIVDMLRNEKPCGISYQSSNWAGVYTGDEPVGEEETE